MFNQDARRASLQITKTKLHVMEKYKDKYRIPSARKPFRYYDEDDLYYITICTFEQKTILGHIEGCSMILSTTGKIVDEEWNKSFEIRKELFCVAYVIMPNHIHAILRIENSLEKNFSESIRKSNGMAYRSPKSISSFVAGFKSSVTKRINTFIDARPFNDERRTPCVSTVWQSRFHDHIIRDSGEYQKILDYIHNNPTKWENDEFFRLL
jgi:putative transposase